ncbi:hypothetical protein, partial [Nostoc sp.]
ATTTVENACSIYSNITTTISGDGIVPFSSINITALSVRDSYSITSTNSNSSSKNMVVPLSSINAAILSIIDAYNKFALRNSYLALKCCILQEEFTILSLRAITLLEQLFISFIGIKYFYANLPIFF